MKTLNVDLGERTYPIHIGHDLIDSDLLGSVIKGHQVLLVSNETVASLYLERVLSNLTAFEVATVILPDGENHKNIETLDLIFSASAMLFGTQILPSFRRDSDMRVSFDW